MPHEEKPGLLGGADEVSARQRDLRAFELALQLRCRQRGPCLGQSGVHIAPLVGRKLGAFERRGEILDRTRQIADLPAEKSALRPQRRARAPALRERVGLGERLADAPGARQDVDQNSDRRLIGRTHGSGEPRRPHVHVGLGGRFGGLRSRSGSRWRRARPALCSICDGVASQQARQVASNTAREGRVIGEPIGNPERWVESPRCRRRVSANPPTPCPTGT